MIYFISDTHFNHRNIIVTDRPNFRTVEEHDDYIMKIIERLNKDDVLYHLGDVGYPDYNIRERLKRARCKKILIKGNHDKYGKDFYKSIGFDEVYNTPVYLENRIVLSHEPLLVTPGILNVHGHLHGAIINEPNYINANVSEQNYLPVPLKRVQKQLLRLKKDSSKFLHEWYADKYTFTRPKSDVVMDENGLIDLPASLEKVARLYNR